MPVTTASQPVRRQSTPGSARQKCLQKAEVAGVRTCTRGSEGSLALDRLSIILELLMAFCKAGSKFKNREKFSLIQVILYPNNKVTLYAQFGIVVTKNA